MRQVGTLSKGRDVKVLEDHLTGLGMTTRVDDRPDGWVVWVYNEDHFERARQELVAFQDNPDDPRYQAAAEEAARVRRKKEQAEKQFRKNFVDMSGRWGYVSWRRRPLTLSLIVACVAVAVVSQFDDPPGSLRRLLYLNTYHFDEQGGQRWEGLEAVRRGEVWRLITPIFIHYGLLHLLFNMLWLRELGGLIEVNRGTLRLAILVFGSAIVSNLGQYYLFGPSRFGGMSGVVFALFGYVWMKTLYEPEQGMLIHQNQVALVLLWFVLCTTGAVGPIANGAHGVGLAVGIVFGLARL